MCIAVVLKHENHERIKAAIRIGYRKVCRRQPNENEQNIEAPELNYFSGNKAITLVFPFCANGSLEHFLRYHANNGLSLNWMLKVAKSVAEALEFLISRGIRHRDLAARNSLLFSYSFRYPFVLNFDLSDRVRKRMRRSLYSILFFTITIIFEIRRLFFRMLRVLNNQ